VHNLALVVAVGALLGLVMGLLGGGGGILAVPLLVALGVGVREASTASLVVVGFGALAGLIPHHFARRVDWRLGITFGLLGAGGAIVGAKLGVVVSPWVLAVGFPILLVLAGIAMLRSARTNYGLAQADQSSVDEPDETEPARIRSWPLTIALATGIGMVTGFFGVGGGFLVVPALVAAMKIPVRRATATGLVVIAINSAVALIVRSDVAPAWSLTFTMAAATAVFCIIGALLSRRVAGWVLSAGFGALTIAVAIYSVVRIVVSGVK
jgi:uncharacterized membrane protein YfcA